MKLIVFIFAVAAALLSAHHAAETTSAEMEEAETTSAEMEEAETTSAEVKLFEMLSSNRTSNATTPTDIDDNDVDLSGTNMTTIIKIKTDEEHSNESSGGDDIVRTKRHPVHKDDEEFRNETSLVDDGKSIRNQTFDDNRNVTTHDQHEEKNTEKRHTYLSGNDDYNRDAFQQPYDTNYQQQQHQQQFETVQHNQHYGGKGGHQTGMVYEIDEEAAKLRQYERTIPGVPGRDYPILYAVPQTGFQCPGQIGLYGDVSSRCQAWHFCQEGGRVDSFLCPNGSLFNQQYLVCDWWYNVECETTRQFYGVNAQYAQQYGNRPGFGYNKGHGGGDRQTSRPVTPRITTYRPVEHTTARPVYPQQPNYVVPQVPRVVVNTNYEKGDYGQASSSSNTFNQNHGQGGSYGQAGTSSGTHGQGVSSGSYGQSGSSSGTYGQAASSGSYEQSGSSSSNYGKGSGQGSASGTYGQGSSSGTYGITVRPAGQATYSGSYGQSGSSGTYGQSGSSGTFGQATGNSYGSQGSSSSSTGTYAKGSSSSFNSYRQVGSSSGTYSKGGGSYAQVPTLTSGTGSYGKGVVSGNSGVVSKGGTYQQQNTVGGSYAMGGGDSGASYGQNSGSYGQREQVGGTRNQAAAAAASSSATYVSGQGSYGNQNQVQRGGGGRGGGQSYNQGEKSAGTYPSGQQQQQLNNQFGYEFRVGTQYGGQRDSSSSAQGSRQLATATVNRAGPVFPNPTAVSQSSGGGYRYVYTSQGGQQNQQGNLPRVAAGSSNQYAASSSNRVSSSGANGAYEYSHSSSYPGGSSSVYHASQPRAGTGIKSGYQYPPPDCSSGRCPPGVQAPRRVQPPTPLVDSNSYGQQQSNNAYGNGQQQNVNTNDAYGGGGQVNLAASRRVSETSTAATATVIIADGGLSLQNPY